MNYKEKRKATIEKYFPKPVSGNGIVNDVINNLPFEAHFPGGYQYLGPGTNLALKMEKNIRPKNKLDAHARDHDIAYSKSNNLKDRHAADYRLEQDAWKRVKAPDASLGEKAAAWVTTNMMKAKQALGAGVSMSSYTKYPIDVGENDKINIANAAKLKTGVQADVRLVRTKNSVANQMHAPLTKYQIKKIKKASKNGDQSVKIKFSAKQVQKFKQGGLLPAALLAAAPVVAGIASNLYNSYVNKKANDRLIEEKIRHNRAMERSGEGLYIQTKPKALKGGEGLYMNTKPKVLKKKTKSKALNSKRFKKKTRRRGKGLYMSRRPKELGGYCCEGNGLLTELLRKKKKLR